MPEPTETYETLRRERALYRALLELGCREEIDPFLDEALSLVVALTGARRAYIELVDERDPSAPPRFWAARDLYDSEVEEIQTAFSRGIIDEVIRSGEPVVIDSARSDPRWARLKSVQRNSTEAVLCAPLSAPHVGVLYLQDRKDPGPFTKEHVQVVGDVARWLAKSADRLLLRQRQLDETDHTTPFRKKINADAILGRSRAIARVLYAASRVARGGVTVLLTGPSGTGKTQLARVIHENSRRAQGPFIEQNCAAIPDTLLENELFGAEQGAHSTAKRSVAGRVKAAEGGTLFLDEVGELSLTAQAKLLQLLDSKTYFALGADHPTKANVRVIAATNADLKSLIAKKTFREDLYYRLEKATLHMPSLAERPEDIALLAEHFCELACASAGGPHLRLGVGAVRALEAATWPGNVRELANCVERAVIFAEEGVLELDSHHVRPSDDAGAPERRSFHEQTRRFQKQLIERALEVTGNNRTEAAKLLELSRAHLYNLIDEFWPKRNPG